MIDALTTSGECVLVFFAVIGAGVSFAFGLVVTLHVAWLWTNRGRR